MDEQRPITTRSPEISDAGKIQAEGMIEAIGTPVHEGLVPRILTRPEHKLSRKDLSQEAIKVLYRLHRSGYAAHLVGGSVRDLLLGRRPKDFDVATNARPQEIRRLFRNSRIIGRRFRLVHVFFKGEIVEVAKPPMTGKRRRRKPQRRRPLPIRPGPASKKTSTGRRLRMRAAVTSRSTRCFTILPIFRSLTTSAVSRTSSAA